MNTLGSRIGALAVLLMLALFLPHISGGAPSQQTAQTPTATAVGEPIESNGPGAIVATNSPLPAGATAPAGESAAPTPTSPSTPRAEGSPEPVQGGASTQPSAATPTATLDPNTFPSSDTADTTATATTATATTTTATAATPTPTDILDPTSSAQNNIDPYPAAAQLQVIATPDLRIYLPLVVRR